MVQRENMKIDPINNIDTIKEKFLWYRKISNTELQELDGNPQKVYDYKFNEDEIFTDMYLKNFQVKIFNSGSIFDIHLDVNLSYKIEKDWLKYSNLQTEKIEKIIFDL
jgi:hypothetical protein